MLLKGTLILLTTAFLECQSSDINIKDMLKQVEKNQNILSTLRYSYEILHKDWKAFKETHNKKYDSDEEDLHRMGIFAQNQLIIAKHNDLYQKGLVTFTLKMNKFGDVTTEEFNNIYLMKNMSVINHHLHKRRLARAKKEKLFTLETAGDPFPDTIDWRTKGAVSDVKDQGSCGCCWAFSATGALEAYFHRKNGYLVSLSEQNLIDCSRKYSNHACSGGRPYYAFQYVMNNKGIDTEKSYTYVGTDQTCNYNPKFAVPSPKRIFNLQKNEFHLKLFVARLGPVSVLIHVEDTFQFYEKGVYYSKTCSSDVNHLNHAVLVIGYGVAEYGGEYWLVKNSFGEHWGEDGYIKMARDRDNNCGIVTEATFMYDELNKLLKTT